MGVAEPTKTAEVGPLICGSVPRLGLSEEGRFGKPLIWLPDRKTRWQKKAKYQTPYKTVIIMLAHYWQLTV